MADFPVDFMNHFVVRNNVCYSRYGDGQFQKNLCYFAILLKSQKIDARQVHTFYSIALWSQWH